MNVPSIDIADFDYELPDEKIARFPLGQRDQSRLLVAGDHEITETGFAELPDFLPERSLLIFNDTRVIRARLVFYKTAGARIEVFCLQPLGGYGQYRKSTWKCLIGNAKKWKSGPLKMTVPTPAGDILLQASRGQALGEAYQVSFEWDSPAFSFEQVREFAGKIPLPPYLNREPVESDTLRYQTIYARNNGSVAAPTAGLHFTPAILESLESRGCAIDYLTLHVGAGTFRPVSASDAREHLMHEEELIVRKELLMRLLGNLNGNITAVGTTSMRSLESIYWLGAGIVNGKEPGNIFRIQQWEPYSGETRIPPAEALQAILDYMSHRGVATLRGFTGIMIVPGYRFRICKALVTNFHQPKSTLLLLVAAFIGQEWKKAYDFALEKNFRFLSYGDSCLFFRKEVGAS